MPVLSRLPVAPAGGLFLCQIDDGTDNNCGAGDVRSDGSDSLSDGDNGGEGFLRVLAHVDPKVVDEFLKHGSKDYWD